MEMKSLVDETHSTESFTVLQFNVLADGLSGRQEEKGGFDISDQARQVQ